MSEHTDGPWKHYKPGQDYGWRVIHPAGDAELGNWMMAERIRREADARLIAASPDMYQALTLAHDLMLSLGYEGTGPFIVVDRALAKAEGRS